jgi:FkbM family methyltransferase
VTAAVVAAVGRRVARRRRLATRLMRLPAVLPRPFRARLYRSLSWPLATKLAAETEVEVIGGSRMFVRTDDLVGRVIAISGVWEPNLTALFKSALAPGDVCIDVGAHIGYYTLLAARVVGPGGHVYAFEPSPSNNRALRRNIALNKLPNVTALDVAAGAETRRATLYEGPATNSGQATLNAAFAAKSAAPLHETTVEVAPVASLVPEEEWDRTRVIKIDVEWEELDVLRGLQPVFDRGRPLSVFLEWTPRRAAPSAADDLRRVCEAQGFAVYRVGGGYSLERLFPDRVEQAVRVSDIPEEQTDLLLRR